MDDNEIPLGMPILTALLFLEILLLPLFIPGLIFGGIILLKKKIENKS